LFGYIRPFEPQLRVCELEEYRAVYCGLCRTLAERFGPLARMSLSYDFTFFTMLELSLQEAAPTYSKQRCPMMPVRKRLHLDSCPASRRACEIAILLLREKCADNLDDEKFPKSLLWHAAAPLINGAAKGAAAAEPDYDAVCRDMTRRQREAQADPAAGIDLVCDPTATALGTLLASFSEDDAQQRILQRMGYMLGRYIYLCDAVDDLEKDRQNGAFNPLPDAENKSEYAYLLRMVIAEACHAYDLLEPRYYRGVLDNIMHLGLQNTADRLTEGRTVK